MVRFSAFSPLATGVAILAVLALAASPSVSYAADAYAVVSPGKHWVVFEAAPGEVNRLRIEVSTASRIVRLSDSAATITPGTDCQADVDGRVVCQLAGRVQLVQADLGDGVDRADVATVSTTAAQVNVTGGEGDDVIRARGSSRFDFAGNEGDDVLVGGEGPDVLRGQDGNDMMSGRGRSDLLIGDAGDDVLRAHTGSDRLFGGLGADKLDARETPPFADSVADCGPGRDVTTLDRADRPVIRRCEVRRYAERPETGSPEAHGAATTNGLLLTADDVPGLHPTARGLKVARSALGVRDAPRQLRRATARGAAFAGDGRRLRVGVYVLGTRARATAALRSTGRGFKRLGGIADAARVRTRTSGRSTDAVVLLRSNATLAAVRFEAPRGTSPATSARWYARALAARVERAQSRTEWERALDGIRADGSITPSTALRAFASAYGPLPGVKRVRGRGEAPQSATLAMQLVARVWPQLSAAQRIAIDRALGAPHDASSPASARAADQTLTPDAGYQAIADKYLAYFLQRLPTTGPIVIKVFRASENITTKTGAKAAADALPVNDAGQWGVGTPAYCRVRVPPVGQSQSPAALDHILAHEVFHCFQFHLMKDWRMRTAWLVEGTAEWAAAVASQASEAIAGGSYREYITSPATPLFARSYSATGFWGHADEVEGIGSLWGKIPAIFDAPDDETSYVLAGATNTSFVDTWASSTFRFGAALPAWNQVTPYAISYKKTPPPATTLSTGTTIGSSPYSLRQFVAVLSQEQPLINVTRLGGSLRAGTSTKDFGLVSSEWFCAKKCVCPNGTSGQIPPHKTVNGPLLSLALTAGTGKGGGRVTFHALDTYCKPPKPGVTVSGATGFTVTDGMYCVRPEPGVLQVQMPLNSGGNKVAQVVLEIKGYTGAGTYPTGPSVATVYDFRDDPPAHLWETPETGSIVVGVVGGPAGNGSSGTVDSVSSVMVEGVKSTVTVTGSWRC